MLWKAIATGFLMFCSKSRLVQVVLAMVVQCTFVDPGFIDSGMNASAGQHQMNASIKCSSLVPTLVSLVRHSVLLAPSRFH